jgi:CheY-like chemotaxis protein
VEVERDRPRAHASNPDGLWLQGNLGLQETGGADPFAKTYEGPIDLLVCDVVMPELNGRELAECALKLRSGLDHLEVPSQG